MPRERHGEEEPCHHIPLNEKGETIASLAGHPEKIEKVLLDWLRATFDRLEREEAASKGAS